MANDPATDRRISRLSLISSAANLYSNEGPPDPKAVLEAAQMWETWVYGAETPHNGFVHAPAPEPAPVVNSGPVCAECGQPLTEVAFKTGKRWSVQELANFGQTKFGRLLCKAHYFGKKPVG